MAYCIGFLRIKVPDENCRKIPVTAQQHLAQKLETKQQCYYHALDISTER